jgi:hypothetical protein
MGLNNIFRGEDEENMNKTLAEGTHQNTLLRVDDIKYIKCKTKM